ncbi:DNA translocase FtsK 4TM domain-containing protein [Marinibaculum pumilum]|uniref:DNA translocase FtsK n=1 Tax=Marinibaculum pumilum TaxID=1766165 RepID=A0ABV7KYN2_9PROT
MSVRSGDGAPAQILPDGVRPFLVRRSVELAGGLLLALGIALALALISFHAADPSWNLSAVREPRNWLGLPGATLADALYQALGIAAFLLPVAALAWGWRLVSHRGLPLWWLNLLVLPLLLATAAAAAAVVPRFEDWPMRSGLGGVLGDLVYADLVLPLVAPLQLNQAPLICGLGFFLASIALLVVALGLSGGEWRGMARGVGHGAGWTARGMVVGGRAVGRGGERIADLRDRLRRAANDDGSDGRETPLLPRPDAAEAERPARSRRIETRRAAAEDAGDEEEDEAVPQRTARVEVRPAAVRQGRRAAKEKQPELALARPDAGDGFALPPLGLLTAAPASTGQKLNQDALEQNARLLESVLGEFGVSGEIVRVRPGPVVTLYELEPAPGTKSSRVIGLADDIARSMAALSARIAVIPGRNAIGIELPNADRETVYLRELLASRTFEEASAKLPLALGKDIGGDPVIGDLARMPHLLVAGTTGSGKSVAINTMILSLLYRHGPDDCRFIMVDPKMLELSVYDDIPHLLAPVVTDPSKAVVALKWAVREMEERYRRMSDMGVRNISGFNARLAEAAERKEGLSRTVQTGFDPESGDPIFEEIELDLTPMPYIVVVIDELADLMLVAGKDIEAAIQRLAQMARAAGIHLIVATQRPSVDVITGTIKSNFPTRISFQVSSKIDSRTILGEQGGEQLLGMGDMLFMAGAGRLQRVHGPFVSDREVEEIVAYLRDQGAPAYDDAVTADPDEFDDGDDGGAFGAGGGGKGGSSEDQLYDQAVAIVCRERKASTSFVQRQLQIGYNRAARIVERMEAEGVVSKANHVGKRQVLARDIDEMAAN